MATTDESVTPAAAPQEGVYLAAQGRGVVNVAGRVVWSPGRFCARVTNVSDGMLVGEDGPLCSARDGFVILPRAGDVVYTVGTTPTTLMHVGVPDDGGMLPVVLAEGDWSVDAMIEATRVDPRTTVTIPTTDERAELAGIIYAMHRKAQQAKQDLDRLVEDVHRYADSQQLGDGFDAFLREHGLPGRPRDYAVEVEVSATVEVRVRASSPEEARGKVSAEQVLEQLSIYCGDYGGWPAGRVTPC